MSSILARAFHYLQQTHVRTFVAKPPTLHQGVHNVMPQQGCKFLLQFLLRKVLKQIFVGELQPDDTVDAVREARLLAKVSAAEADTAARK